ncbi:hypothetical protein CVT26_001542, partial [Gymnopilus dilepis]
CTDLTSDLAPSRSGVLNSGNISINNSTLHFNLYGPTGIGNHQRQGDSTEFSVPNSFGRDNTTSDSTRPIVVAGSLSSDRPSLGIHGVETQGIAASPFPQATSGTNNKSGERSQEAHQYEYLSNGWNHPSTHALEYAALFVHKSSNATFFSPSNDSPLAGGGLGNSVSMGVPTLPSRESSDFPDLVPFKLVEGRQGTKATASEVPQWILRGDIESHVTTYMHSMVLDNDSIIPLWHAGSLYRDVHGRLRGPEPGDIAFADDSGHIIPLFSIWESQTRSKAASYLSSGPLESMADPSLFVVQTGIQRHQCWFTNEIVLSSHNLAER